ncbi:MAG: TetR/AcrR family transcriptional regulator [Albidovulum sp.]|uniref:TetR/AcrR family transcriptional regulator n=1 Tax=Albidovulum sp. TaxID=1872424 RepID=UPI003CB73647
MSTTAEDRLSARDLGKERHRLKLIEATANAILEHGLAAVSVSRILEHAGLSRGMINLHFTSKANLLLEVARHFSDAYANHWQAAMNKAGPRPEDRLRAIVEADFDPAVLNRRTMAIWFAFRGEAHSNPDYMPFIDSREGPMTKAVHDICSEICAGGTYPEVDPTKAARAFTIALEGLWTDFHLHPNSFSRDEARSIVLHMARTFFPQHFGD